MEPEQIPENDQPVTSPAEPEPEEEKSSSLLPSLVSEIVISMSVLMVAAIILMAILINWLETYWTPEYYNHAHYVILPYIFLFSLTVAVFGWRLITRLILKPLREILDATDRVAAGDLSHRLHIKENRELDRLAHAYNRMTSRLDRNRRDLTERVEELRVVNRNLEQTQRELLSSEKLAVVGRLAAGVAHEIGNPLSAMAGYLEILHRRTYIESRDLEMIERIQGEVSRIHEIIKELLDYSRPQDSSSSLIDLNAAVESTLTLLSAQKGFENLKVACRLGEITQVRANRSSIQQLIVNLAINAAQAMPKGGRLSILTGARERQGKSGVELVVADTGPGIDPENLERIFDPFFTTKDPGQGTGLGLSICQRIVENMNGRIEVESKEGAGTSFKVWLPAEAPSPGGVKQDGV